MQDPIDYNAQCDELVYSLSKKLQGKTFANKEACIASLLSGNANYNSFPQDYQQQVADRLWTRYERPYVRKILDRINHDYFTSDHPPKQGTWQPKKALANDDRSRVFDLLNLDDLFSSEDIETFYQNFLDYGDEYALSQLVNPLLTEVIDFKNQSLKKSFIDRNLGSELYESINKDPVEICSGFLNAFKLLITHVLAEKNKLDLKHPLPLFFVQMQISGKIDKLRFAEHGKTPVLFDETKKYFFCKPMSDAENSPKFRKLGILSVFKIAINNKVVSMCKSLLKFSEGLLNKLNSKVAKKKYPITLIKNIRVW